MNRLWPVLVLLVMSTLAVGRAVANTAAPTDSVATKSSRPDSLRWSSFLPLLKDEAVKRGIELPLPFGVATVYYHLDRAIEVTDVRIGRNGAPPTSVSHLAQLSSGSKVDNLDLKIDAWILPFLNVYVLGGYLWNESDTRIDVTLPPLVAGGAGREKVLHVPTSIEGSLGGVGMTVAGGYGPFFLTVDANAAQADLGFDDRFKAVVTSARGGWNGKLGRRPFRAWANVTDWNTFATARATVPDPDGGTLAFEADQGPAYRYTYGVGQQYSFTRRWEFATDVGFDAHGGWYLALVPVFRM